MVSTTSIGDSDGDDGDVGDDWLVVVAAAVVDDLDRGFLKRYAGRIKNAKPQR